MTPSELTRALGLNKRFSAAGHRLEDFLIDGFDVVVAHSNSTIFACNDATTSFTGYSSSELIGRNAWTLFSPKSAATISENLSNQSVLPYNAVMRRKDLSQALIELRGVNVEIDGEPVRVVLARLVQELSQT